MPTNADLNKAAIAKKDEFYTQLTDIEKEMKYYTNHFKDQVIFCNCDDPETSNFWKYFELNFDRFGLKELIATHYETDKPSYKIELIRDINNDGVIDKKDIIKTQLRQNGDFRSPECIEILKKADIVITNPPFSLFREYIAQLIEYNKKFIIIGNLNALHYKEIFPLIKDNKVWLGKSITNGDREFRVPDNYPLNASGWRIDKEGIKYIRVKGVRWFTNLEYDTRFEDLILYKHYTPKDYPKYVNYDAIEVSKVTDIPVDYYGKMGVPDTFLQKYNPSQFEIIGYGRGDFLPEIECVPQRFIEEYRAIGGKGHITSGMKTLCFYKDGKPTFPFSRIIIKRK